MRDGPPTDGKPYDPAPRESNNGGVGNGGTSDVGGSTPKSVVEVRTGVSEDGGPDPAIGLGRLNRPKLTARSAGDLGVKIRLIEPPGGCVDAPSPPPDGPLP